ncbi:MAG: hypothetical protein P8R54_11130 [Myxococcota bacterium]|nr:hypothetical protein [Myxococcota bacterium]
MQRSFWEADPMDSPLARYLMGHALGTLHEQIALKEPIALPGGGVAPAWLCHTDRGVFIAGVAGAPGAVLDLGRATELRFQGRAMGDRIAIGGQAFTLPIGSGDRVRVMIARTRLSIAAAHPVRPPRTDGPFVQPSDALETLWLSSALAPNEPLIAWLPTASEHTFPDSIGGQVDAPMWFLMTADRTLLVAISRYGEAHTQSLPAAPIVLTENRLTRDTAMLGEHTWRLPRGGLERLIPLHALPAKSRDRRLRAAARLLALRSHPGAATALLDAIQSLDPLDRLSRAVLCSDPAGRRAALRDLTTTDSDAGRLTLWARRWEQPLSESRMLLGEVLDALSTDSASWAIPLHRQIRDLQLAEVTDLSAQAEIDLELAEHLIISDRRAEAVTILEPRWEKLPDEELRAVLPPPGADLTSGEGGPPLHIRTLELLAIARGPDATPELSAVAALARHLPLVSARLDALAQLDDPLLSPRAAQIRTLLDPGGLTPSEADRPPPPRPLAPAQIESVRHPVARESGTMGWLQAALARVSPPEQGALQDFCEQISVQRHPEVVDAIASACVALGMPAVPGFISMGQKRVGVRSHERPEPFLLIGGDHLNPSSDLFLRPAELRAVIGAEIAHLRFGHSRITSSDVWAGVWDKGTTAIEAAAFFLPFMKFIPVDLIGKQRTYAAVAQVIPVSWLRQIYEVDEAANLTEVVAENIGKLGDFAGGAASTASGHMGTASAAAGKLMPAQKAKTNDVGQESARVLAAHRTMQLTADRAALLLSRDPVATVRAMCLVHSRLAAELVIAERVGLRSALARRGPDGVLILPDLTLRIAALVAFYLSEEYTTLTTALAAR